MPSLDKGEGCAKKLMPAFIRRFLQAMPEELKNVTTAVRGKE